MTRTDAAVPILGSRPFLFADPHIGALGSVASSNARLVLLSVDSVAFRPARVRLAGDLVLLWYVGDADIPSPTKTCLSPSRRARKLLAKCFGVLPRGQRTWKAGPLDEDLPYDVVVGGVHSLLQDLHRKLQTVEGLGKS
jgi:hypothetical protein